MSTWQPYYRRYKPADKWDISDYLQHPFADFEGIYKPPAGGGDPGMASDARDARARAVLAAKARDFESLPSVLRSGAAWFGGVGLAMLTRKQTYNRWTTKTHLEEKLCLTLMACEDYFNVDIDEIKKLVSAAIMSSQPGWCGTFGPDMNQERALFGDASEGNYDMGQMFLAAIAYAYYDQLELAAQTRLIEDLLGNAIIARLNLDDTPIRGPLPDDWDRAGYFKCGSVPPFFTGWGPGVNVKDNGETENHILMMLAARYLVNQLLFQRTRDERYDNRRNGADGAPSCTQLALQLLRNILSDDFSEYNAKNYQEETRWALLTLSSYAYDDEVRLAARMVLDYLSAKMAVSSSDLRRLLPFRRRNEGTKKSHDLAGVMQCGLVFNNDEGADPMLPYFAVQTGNIRACRVPDGKNTVTGMPIVNEIALEVVSDYRVPNPILDLIVDNPSRRFFQRLHRRVVDNDAPGQKGGNRTADNMEIYAGSPSYLITAGSEATDYAIDPRLPPASAGLIAGVVGGSVNGAVGGEVFGAAFGPMAAFVFALQGLVVGEVSVGAIAAALGAIFLKGFVLNDQSSQLGVAVTTSFMPAAGNEELEAAKANVEAPFGRWLRPNRAQNLLIQFGSFSQNKLPADDGNGVANYGVAPDFACGWGVSLPDWLTSTGKLKSDGDGWSFADFSSKQGSVPLPGFYLALLRRTEYFLKRGWSDLAVLEVFDTLADPTVTFEQFRIGVRSRNPSVVLKNNVPGTYTTTNGNQISFVIWHPDRVPENKRRGAATGAEVLSVKYANPISPWARGDAATDGGGLVNGTVLNSIGGAVITIDNPVLNQQIRLDLSDMWNPRRTDENGVVEEAGKSHEIWTDFDWTGTQEGDVYRPFAKLASAAAKVADHGTIRMIPSATKERNPIGVGKRFTLIAPIGQVKIGVK
jgi:hypothetical protein